MKAYGHSIHLRTPTESRNDFDAMNAYQRSAAFKAAIELDVFTAIGGGNRTVETIARAAGASTRGIRILCDYLTLGGFLSKEGHAYSLSQDSATFLDKNSPAYVGTAVQFLLDPRLISPFLDLAAIVRTGTTTLPGKGTVSHENPIWVEFAKAMAPLFYPTSVTIAEMVAGDRETRVLDIAAGHGLFGVSIAKRSPRALVTALDWPSVLAVAKENAQKAGVSDRYSTIEGDAFDVEFGGLYDVVLVTNFFHHYDPPTCERLMRKILSALAPNGRCVTLEFIPNEDRVSPPSAAAFALMMLGTTPAGDAFTFTEYQAMFRNAGFASSEFHELPGSPEAVIISRKA